MKKIAFVGAPGSGKAQPYYSKILTPSGWVNMGDTYVGMDVLSYNGEKAKITGVFDQGIKNISRISFYDGRTVDCCDEHLWNVYSRNRRTIQILPTNIIKNKIENSKEYFTIPLFSPKETKDIKIQMESYLLGALLGNGGFSSGSIIFSSNDEDILIKLASTLDYYGCCLKKIKQQKYDYRIIKNPLIKGKQNNIKNIITDFGLFGCKSHEKFIPKCYFNVSLKQKIELIRGLMDTDGFAGKNGGLSYSTTSKQLAKDFQNLIFSIGGIATIKEKVTSYTYKNEKKQGRICYIINIRYNKPYELFSLTRKKERLLKYQYEDCLRNRIIKIENIGQEKCRCIMIDHPDHLYVTDNYIITHNTTTCHDVFVKLKKKKHKVELISEYAREYIQKHGAPESIYEQYSIYTEQKNREQNIPQNIDYVVMDVLPCLSFFYASKYANYDNPRERIVLQDLYKILLDDLVLKRYDYIFFIPTNQTYSTDAKDILNDGVRYHSEDDISVIEQHMDLMFNKLHNYGNVYRLDCPIEERSKTVMNILLDKKSPEE